MIPTFLFWDLQVKEMEGCVLGKMQCESAFLEALIFAG